MGVRNPQEVPTNVASNPAKDRLGKPLVLGRAAHMSSTIPGDEQTCGCAVVRNGRGVDRHETAALAERCFRPAEQPEGTLVVEVMEHAECQVYIEIP
jgi:hypothetical protein